MGEFLSMMEFNKPGKRLDRLLLIEMKKEVEVSEGGNKEIGIVIVIKLFNNGLIVVCKA